MKKLFLLLLILGAMASLSPSVMALGEEDTGMAGCNAVAVDPNASFEEQQAVCSAAEQFPKSSCAAGGHGVCSSPKTDGTLMDGTHCVCLSVSEETAVV